MDMKFGHYLKTEEELKPCPFCGGEPFLAIHYGYSVDYDDYSINIYECGCSKCDISYKCRWDKDEVINLWNRRIVS